MPITIQGTEFSGFPGRDFDRLGLLDFVGRVQWLKYRVDSFFLDPFDKLVAMENHSYIWLCAVALLTSAVEALSSFEFDDRSGMDRFSKFVERYFRAEFSALMTLQEPRAPQRVPAVTPATQLYRYFRSGLAHSFCIEWGGLQHLEDGAPAYLFEAQQGMMGERSLGVVPRELVADFKNAVAKYFSALEARAPTDAEAIRFDVRFRETFMNKARPPLPAP